MTDVSRDDILQRIFSDAERSKEQRQPVHGGDGDGELDEIIAGLVFAQRPIVGATREILERYDLGPRGSFILSLIDNGVTYPLELASVLKIGRSLVTSELNRLIGAGLVSASPEERDRRRSQLSLTPAGAEAATTFRQAVLGVLKRNLAKYGPQELQLFARMLKDVRGLDA